MFEYFKRFNFNIILIYLGNYIFIVFFGIGNFFFLYLDIFVVSCVLGDDR